MIEPTKPEPVIFEFADGANFDTVTDPSTGTCVAITPLPR
jgi:hypothetical protein